MPVFAFRSMVPVQEFDRLLFPLFLRAVPSKQPLGLSDLPESLRMQIAAEPSRCAAFCFPALPFGCWSYPKGVTWPGCFDIYPCFECCLDLFDICLRHHLSMAGATGRLSFCWWQIRGSLCRWY